MLTNLVFSSDFGGRAGLKLLLFFWKNIQVNLLLAIYDQTMRQINGERKIFIFRGDLLTNFFFIFYTFWA